MTARTTPSITTTAYYKDRPLVGVSRIAIQENGSVPDSFSMKRKVAYKLQCAGCGCLYESADPKRLYCDRRCSERCRRLARRTIFPTPLASAIAFGQAEILFREDLYRTCPTSAVGYRLKCREISLWFPIEGETKRYDGHLRSDQFFRIDPFEAPLVPIDSYYDLEWVTVGGHVIETKTEYPVRVTFAHRTKPKRGCINIGPSPTA